MRAVGQLADRTATSRGASVRPGMEYAEEEGRADRGEKEKSQRRRRIDRK